MNQSHATVYETIGTEYNRHRAAEPSVVRELARLLGLERGSKIADIGAGTGNYSNALAQLGYRVEAVEPSRVMRGQAVPMAGVAWHVGCAEAIPLPDRSVDGIVSTLASHHFASLEKAAMEMRRVCPTGPVVILTIDPRLGESFWFSDYFPAIHERLFSAFQPLDSVCETLCRHTGFKAEIVSHLLVHDAVDITMHSGWNRPEIYLDANQRRSMSGFALAAPEEVEPGLVALQADLVSDEWDRRHGHLRKQLAADLGFRLIKLANPQSGHG